jgi:hypothetical protein
MVNFLNYLNLYNNNMTTVNYKLLYFPKYPHPFFKMHMYHKLECVACDKVGNTKHSKYHPNFHNFLFLMYLPVFQVMHQQSV